MMRTCLAIWVYRGVSQLTGKLKIVLALLISGLGGCVSHLPEFVLPEQVEFEGKTFTKVTDNRLDELRQLLYLPSKSDQTPQHWQQGILFFLDQNMPPQTLAQRVSLRQQTYAKQPETLAKIALDQGELHSEVIYPPTERFADIQLEVSRGRNLPCGFGQIQYVYKGAVEVKNQQIPVKDYAQQIAKIATRLAQLPWQIECK